MRAVVAHLLRLLCAVAFLTGVTLDVACRAAMADQVAPAPSSQTTIGHNHDCGMDAGTGGEDRTSPDHVPGKVACCHAIGSVAPALTSTPSQVIPPSLARSVSYWGSGAERTGRAIEPAIGPPRSI